MNSNDLLQNLSFLLSATSLTVSDSFLLSLATEESLLIFFFTLTGAAFLFLARHSSFPRLLVVIACAKGPRNFDCHRQEIVIGEEGVCGQRSWTVFGSWVCKRWASDCLEAPQSLPRMSGSATATAGTHRAAKILRTTRPRRRCTSRGLRARGLASLACWSSSSGFSRLPSSSIMEMAARTSSPCCCGTPELRGWFPS